MQIISKSSRYYPFSFCLTNLMHQSFGVAQKKLVYPLPISSFHSPPLLSVLVLLSSTLCPQRTHSVLLDRSEALSWHNTHWVITSSLSLFSSSVLHCSVIYWTNSDVATKTSNSSCFSCLLSVLIQFSSSLWLHYSCSLYPFVGLACLVA